MKSSLVGRERELAILDAALARAQTGPAVVALRGEAGLGKTRLATAVGERARRAGAVVAWGRAWESGGSPGFWPWTQVLRALIEQVEESAFADATREGTDLIARLVPELGSGTQGDEDRYLVMDAVVTAVRRLSRKTPVVVVLDDVHAYDEASVQLLDGAIRGLTDDDRILLLILADENSGSPEPDRLMGEVARDHVSLTLVPLEEGAIEALYAEIVGSAPSREALTTVMEASEGNPFFAVEMIRMLHAHEEPRRPDHSRGFRVPRGVKEVLGARVAETSEEVRLVLSVGAVLGREFDAGTIGEILALGNDAILKALDEAVESGLVREVSGIGRFGFSHVLMREVFYEGLPMSDRMRTHARAAVTLERRHGSDLEPHLEEIAHHYFKAAQAGDKDKTLNYAIEAGQRAMSRTAHADAVRLYERALKVAELGGVDSGRRRRIAAELAKARELAGRDDPTSASRSGSPSRFVRDGGTWSIMFDGAEFQIRNSKGLQYLAHLLKNPGTEIHALDLVAAVSGPGSATAAPELTGSGLAARGPTGIEAIDPAARASYKARLQALEEELAIADALGSPKRAEAAQAEVDAIVAALKASTGLGGRSRLELDDGERARTSVTKAIKAALARIAASNEALGRHLEATIRTGTNCSYRPDERVPAAWEVG